MGFNLGFGQIAENVGQLATNFGNGILAILGMGQDASTKYPSVYNKYTNKPNYKDGTWRESQGYAFHVVRVLKDQINAAASKAEGWQEFRLQINPQELQQDEIFAIEVTPTFRGVVVEHQGTILKNIRMSGTTGVSPMRVEGGANKRTGKPVIANGHSGFEEFHELRSYIRAYAEAKRQDQKNATGELRLVWKNFKDSEYLFVEPQEFSLKRSASRATLYDYEIVLKGIGIANGVSKPEGDNYGFIGDIVDVVGRASELVYTARQVISGGISTIRRFEADVENTLLRPLSDINTALLAIKGGREQFFGEFGITRRFLENFKSEIGRIENNFNDAIGRNMTEYNTAAGRTSTVVGVSRQSTHEELRILNAFNKAKRGVSIILSERGLFDKDLSQNNEIINKTYNGQISLIDAQSTKSVTIDGEDTIQILATRELGDPDKFRDIVTLNNLKPPYIDEAGGSGVLKPGDSILIPQVSKTESTGVKRNKEYNITKLLSEVEKQLGVDIRLDENNDLAVSNTGDLDLLAGMDNMSQAVLIKLHLEPGDLKRHLTIGTGLKIGEKVGTSRLNQIRDNIIGSLNSDLRVEEIPYISLTQEGGTTRIEMLIKLKGLKQPVPLPITVSNAA